MALNSTPRRRFGVALGVVLTGVTAGLIGFAGIASAHTPAVSADCKGEVTTLKVDLTQYAVAKGKTNHVKITDGTTTLEDKDFGKEYRKSFDVSGAVEHSFTVKITAWDDPEGRNKWTREEKRFVKACVIPPTTTTTTSTTTTTPPSSQTTTTTSTTTTTPPSTQSTTTTTTTTVPTTTTTVPPTTTSANVEEAALASTGASIGLPLGIAGLLLVGGGVLLFIVRRRSKA